MERYRIHDDVSIYFLTFSVIHWLPVFVSEEPCLIITDSLNFCNRNKGLRVNAFVIMPTHIHLIVFNADFDVIKLRQTLVDMRRYTGRRLADCCERMGPAVFGQVMQESQRADRARQFWQQSRHPEAIWSDSFWRSKVAYVHDNPCRKGLVCDATHWRFSSAAYWMLDRPGETDVALTGVEWA